MMCADDFCGGNCSRKFNFKTFKKFEFFFFFFSSINRLCGFLTLFRTNYLVYINSDLWGWGVKVFGVKMV